jgi:hypothetical protein
VLGVFVTTLRPTRSEGGPLRRIPMWVLVVAAALVGVLLIGAGLLLTNGSSSKVQQTPVAATPTCTPKAPSASATKPPTQQITVNVYNSPDRVGLASETAGELDGRGFAVDKITNDPEKADITGTAVVRFVPGNRTAARWVAAQVPGATIVKVPAAGHAGAKVDLVLGQGFDALATETDAKAAFAASVPTPTC